MTPLPHPSVCVSIQNASVCAFNTSPCVPAPRPHVLNMWTWCRYTRERLECTHEGVLDGHTEGFSACHTTHTPHTHHTHTPHTHTQHTHTAHTHQHAHTPQHTETDRQTDTQSGQKLKDEREDERRETRWKTRDKMKDEEDEKTRRKKRQEKIKRDTMCYVFGCVLCSKITGPSKNFEFFKLPLPTLKVF